jgi:hypothetical protein
MHTINIYIMKKLFLIPAFVLGFARSANAQTEVKKTETVEAKVTTQQKYYKEIDPVSVNNDALKTVLKTYKGHSILEAWRAEKGDDKLLLTKDKKIKPFILLKTVKL